MMSLPLATSSGSVGSGVQSTSSMFGEAVSVMVIVYSRPQAQRRPIRRVFRNPPLYTSTKTCLFSGFFLTAVECSESISFMNKVTAVYVRVSTADQRHDSQLKELKEHCRLRQWKNVVVYTEQESGAKVTRPELDRLMKEIRSGKVERVVCYKLDRLGRSLSHLSLMLEELI